jgi:tRNA-dihydrouridine synthase A
MHLQSQPKIKPMTSVNSPCPTIKPSSRSVDRRLSVAPMMEYTDRFCRYFLRLISERTLLYTEMVNSGTIIHGDTDYHLRFDQSEHPIALQLGGSNPTDLAKAIELSEPFGYDEYNLNCGCPSDRVQTGRFGACLMAEPQLVAACVKAMQAVTNADISIKSRIGIDDMDDYEGLRNFVEPVAEAGCESFIIHARKAWLKGLSPKQNRQVPPLNYERVYQLKQEFPQLEIAINGGITSLDQAEQHLKYVDGVMIGREAYHNPFILAEADQRIFGVDRPTPTRLEVYEKFIHFIDQQMAEGVRLNHMTRHLMGLFHGMHGGRKFRRYLSENAHHRDATTDVMWRALEAMQD